MQPFDVVRLINLAVKQLLQYNVFNFLRIMCRICYAPTLKANFTNMHYSQGSNRASFMYVNT